VIPIVWTERALADLLSIGDFISKDNPLAAIRWARMGRVVPELDRNDIREILLGQYRIVYQTREHQIAVLTVFEGHRRLRLTPPDADDP
jgi:plasmid stabilization system protein ParE